MDTKTVRNGVIGGAAGGMVMAMWSMIALAVMGDGFWTSVNLIAHAIWDGAPLGGAFDAGALALGLMAHMAVSMMLGIGIAFVAQRIGRPGPWSVAVGVGVGTVAWIVGAIAWRSLDRVGFDELTPWVSATGHMMFGATVAGWLLVADRLRDSAPVSRVLGGAGAT